MQFTLRCCFQLFTFLLVTDIELPRVYATLSMVPTCICSYLMVRIYWGSCHSTRISLDKYRGQLINGRDTVTIEEKNLYILLWDGKHISDLFIEPSAVLVKLFCNFFKQTSVVCQVICYVQTHNFSSTDLGTFFIDHRFIDHKYHSSGNGQVRQLDGKRVKNKIK